MPTRSRHCRRATRGTSCCATARSRWARRCGTLRRSPRRTRQLRPAPPGPRHTGGAAARCGACSGSKKPRSPSWRPGACLAVRQCRLCPLAGRSELRRFLRSAHGCVTCFWRWLARAPFPQAGSRCTARRAGSSGDPALYAGDGECEVALRASVQRLTREQLALGLLRLLADLEAHARPTHIKHTLSIRGLSDTVHLQVLLLPEPSGLRLHASLACALRRVCDRAAAYVRGEARQLMHWTVSACYCSVCSCCRVQQQHSWNGRTAAQARWSAVRRARWSQHKQRRRGAPRWRRAHSGSSRTRTQAAAPAQGRTMQPTCTGCSAGSRRRRPTPSGRPCTRAPAASCRYAPLLTHVQATVPQHDPYAVQLEAGRERGWARAHVTCKVCLFSEHLRTLADVVLCKHTNLRMQVCKHANVTLELACLEQGPLSIAALSPGRRLAKTRAWPSRRTPRSPPAALRTACALRAPMRSGPQLGAWRQGPRAHTCAWARRSWPRPITRTVTQPAPQRCAPQQCDTLQKDELRASAGHGSAGLAVDSVRAYSRARIS